jgi:uncharacterized DUF497 family protein
MPLTFEWDPRKARSNFSKHAVTFEESATIFGDPLSLTIRDREHSQDEERYVTLGIAAGGKLLVVAHSDRGDNIRIISARRANRRERRFYEEKIK